MSKGIIYCAHCLSTGKKYIGQTKKSLRERQYSHRYYYKKNNKRKFQAAITKYGWDNFVWGIIEECEYSILNEREIYWIDFYNTYKNGYNLTIGGNSITDPTQVKSFQIQSPDGKIYNSSNIANFCRKHNLNSARLGNVINGKSKSHKGWTLPNTKIYGYAMRTEKIIKEFRLLSPSGNIVVGKNITKFAKDNGLSPGYLNQVINGKAKSHKGWRLPLTTPGACDTL